MLKMKICDGRVSYKSTGDLTQQLKDLEVAINYLQRNADRMRQIGERALYADAVPMETGKRK